MHLSIDQSRCSGCGLCVSYAPDLFTLDAKSYKAKLKQGKKLVESLQLNLSSSETKGLKEIVRNCATRSIKLSK